NRGLPDMEELDLIAEIRRRHPSTRLMFCSDSGDFRLAGKAMELGADALAARSCTPEELLGKLRWIEEHAPVPAAGWEAAGDRLKRVQLYVDSHIDQPLRQEDLLDVACLSRSSLHRYFRKRVGMSSSQYVTSRRLERARHLLEHEDAPICEIAGKTGFQDPAYFCRWFKQLTAVTPLAFRSAIRAGKRSLRIGALVPLSGAYGYAGQDVLMGAEFAAAEIARRFGLEISVYPIDTETCPARAAAKVWDAYRRLNIRHFTGCTSSAVLVDVARAVEESHCLLVSSACANVEDRRLNERVFRWSLPAREAVRRTMIPLIRRDPTARRWFTISPDYIFGRALLGAAEAVFREYDIEHVGNAFHELGSRDFRPLFRRARALKAQTIVLLNYGGDTDAALVQAREMNVSEDSQLLVVWSNGLQNIRKIGLESSRGVLFGTQYWENKNLPANNLLRKGWEKQFNHDPNYPNVTGYIGTLMLHMAVQKTGSSDPEANRNALENLAWDGLTAIREFINPDTHQTAKEYFLLQVEPSGRVTELAG
ncbi:MAG: ABC transporter substrate-binding protein, partial [Spirochaetales bacterium]|nr:ABC transporter substrate-binding protein [Spirochaetales bacterium]